jgi:alpha-N-arabinofuranosidase
VSLLRFPGGNFVSGYRWRDGVEPVDGRPVKPNPAWEGVEWNEVGTNEWLRFCELVGAEPMICVNAGDGTPEEAAAWVRYCRGRGVRLWEVGNELYGSWQIGHTDAAGHARRYAAFAAAMRAEDRDIELIACGDTRAWNEALVRANGRSVRSISVHWLPLHGLPRDADPEEVHLDLQGDASELTRRLLAPAAAPMEAAGLVPRLALDELQILNRLNATAVEALFFASVFHQAVRFGSVVELVTHSALINHGGGLVKREGRVAPQPVYWAQWLYATASGDRPVPVALAGPAFASPGRHLPRAGSAPVLDALALRTGDGRRVTVFVINRDPRLAREATVDVVGRGVAASAEVARLAPPSLLTEADPDRPDRLKPVPERVRPGGDGRVRLAFPPHSITRLTLAWR